MLVAEYSENVHVILIDWTEFEDILTDKTQRVSVGGVWSEDRPVINGVPPGSVVLHYLSSLGSVVLHYLCLNKLHARNSRMLHQDFH